MSWAAVIGKPIEHSLSPVLHTAAWHALGLPDHWQYRLVECDEATLPSLLLELDPACIGLSVTMPCKQAVMSLLDAVDPMAQAVGSVNTVIPSGGILTGFNTDVLGISRAIEVASGSGHHSAVILGAGATAASALAALGGMGINDLTLAARRFAGPHSVLRAATRLGLNVHQVLWSRTDDVLAAIAHADIVVSTMPAHVCDALAAQVQPRNTQVLLDVVYSPLDTELVQAWRTKGGRVAHGLDMLTYQAQAQVKLMTGYDVDTAPMTTALMRALPGWTHV
ncbi:shikimate dehydrogenase [Schaalia suimastitidis]|uniref:shikimate dehydrogenase n=1 Tax=Schaalia suimastitidis TaxID=121163 RepID=UPI0004222E9A|nr:shikimate dehydrogenase [Schaalia suimastitidis]